MNKTIFLTAVVMGVVAIVLGAFGAHGLKDMIDAEAIDTFETGVKYQMYHSLFLLVLASIKALPERNKKLIFYLVLLGVCLFSFSIYFLATNDITTFDFGIIGFLTPIGGLLLILGWIVLGYRYFKHFN